MEISCLFKCKACLIQRIFSETRRNKLHPNRQAIGKSGRQGHPRKSGQVDRNRQNIVHVHRHRIVDLFADAVCRRRCRRSQNQVMIFKDIFIVAANQRANLSRLLEERIVSAGRKRERSEHDAALDFIAEAF